MQLLVQMYGSTSSPGAAAFALKKTAKDNAHLYPEKVILAVLQSFYVDDGVKSQWDSKSAVAILLKVDSSVSLKE